MLTPNLFHVVCSAPAVTTGSNGENPFGEQDLDGEEEEGVDLDDTSAGWAVRALYDYDKAEEDEIGFKAGQFGVFFFFFCVPLVACYNCSFVAAVYSAVLWSSSGGPHSCWDRATSSCQCDCLNSLYVRQVCRRWSTSCTPVPHGHWSVCDRPIL